MLLNFLVDKVPIDEENSLENNSLASYPLSEADILPCHLVPSFPCQLRKVSLRNLS